MKTPKAVKPPGFSTPCTGEVVGVMYVCDEVRDKYPLICLSRQVASYLRRNMLNNKPGPKEQRVKCLTGRVKPGKENPESVETAAPPPCSLVTASQHSARYTEQYRDCGFHN